MSIFKAPKLTTEYTGNPEEDKRNLYREYNLKKAKMMNEFAKAFTIVAILGAIGLIAAMVMS